MSNTQKVLTAVIAGAAAGLIAGILIAPRKGSETRSKISDTARQTVDKVKDLTHSTVSAVADTKEKIFGKKNSYEESGIE